MKKIFGILVVCISIVAFIILNKKTSDEVILKFGYASNSQVVKDSMKEFGRLLEEKTDGTVKVIYFPDSQLGGERELIEMVQTGVIDFTKVSGAALESFSSMYSIFGLPYLFDDESHFHRVMQSELVQKFYGSTEHLGFRGLTYYDSGQRSFYMRNKPIRTPEDLKGMKIRVMQSKTAIRMIQLMGGSPVPMSSGEVYTSLQQGILDGSENNEFAITDARHGEVVKYYSYDEHTRVPDIVIMNSSTMDKLDKNQKKALYAAAEESTAFQIKKWGESVSDARKRISEEFGVVFNEVDSKEEFKKLVAPLHDEFKEQDGIGEIYNKILELSKI